MRGNTTGSLNSRNYNTYHRGCSGNLVAEERAGDRVLAVWWSYVGEGPSLGGAVAGRLELTAELRGCGVRPL